MSDHTEAFYEHIDEVKKVCAKRMKSKSHDAQIEKFIDSLWMDGFPRNDIIDGVMYAYRVNKGFAEVSVNCFLNMQKDESLEDERKKRQDERILAERNRK